MIVFKMWKTAGQVKRGIWDIKQNKTWHGYFLFGIIPLYIKLVELIEERH